MASCCVGEQVSAEFLPMMADQMGFDGRGATPPKADEARARRTAFSVAIIGAGFSGLTVALRLREIGVPYVILERADGVGGVWRRNTYPGAGVDTPSQLYSLPYFPRDWSAHFARQPEVLEYLEDLAENFDLLADIRFGTEVRSAEWREDEQCWSLTVGEPGGIVSTVTASAVITAVGLFKEPAIPDLAGRDAFRGVVCHSADWPADLDLTGKRLAVIGTGASAMQIVPASADVCAHVDVFQRTPQWISPVPHYFDAISAETHWLNLNVPYYRQWYRLRLSWVFNDRSHSSMRMDPTWEHRDRSANRANDRHRAYFIDYIRTKLAGRPDLIDKSMPDYPPNGKRLLMDNGWYDAIRKPNIELITEPVAALTVAGVRTADGTEHPADMVALCTGFHTNRYVQPIEFRGRRGTRLRDQWEDDDARAYLGVMTKNFPNLFFMYGPATNAGAGSYVSLAETWLQAITTIIGDLVNRGAGAVEPLPEEHDRYNQELDEENAHMVWSHPRMGTYVRNERGRVTVNMPWRIVDFWTRTAELDLTAFRFDDARPTRRRLGLDHAWPVSRR